MALAGGAQPLFFPTFDKNPQSLSRVLGSGTRWLCSPQNESIPLLPSSPALLGVSGCQDCVPQDPPELAAPTPLCRQSLDPEQTLPAVLLQTLSEQQP